MGIHSALEAFCSRPAKHKETDASPLKRRCEGAGNALDLMHTRLGVLLELGAGITSCSQRPGMPCWGKRRSMLQLRLISSSLSLPPLALRTVSNGSFFVFVSCSRLKGRRAGVESRSSGAPLFFAASRSPPFPVFHHGTFFLFVVVPTFSRRGRGAVRSRCILTRLVLRFCLFLIVNMSLDFSLLSLGDFGANLRLEAFEDIHCL